MLIVCNDTFILVNGKYYCKSYSLLSLSQYWDIFSNVKLLGIEIIGSVVPDGWISIPQEIVFYPINDVNSYNCFTKYKIKKRIWNLIKNENLAYLRMPDYRVLEVYKLIRNKIRFFCEFHGDWEEALLAQKLNTVGFRNKFKYLLAGYRAKIASNYYKEISKNSLINISIGPKLIEKYNLNVKPALATTNHIIKKNMIFERSDFKLKGGILKLLYVGELQHRKGLHYLINALLDLKRYETFKFDLTIIGQGYLESELKEIVKIKKLGNDIKFKGAIYNPEALAKEYKNADVFILPSIAGEGVPRVLQEAQAFGCAVIATNVGSTYWQLQNNSGILIEPKSTEALMNAIKLMFNDEKRKEFSLNATKNAYEFNYEKQKKNIFNFLKNNLDCLVN